MKKLLLALLLSPLIGISQTNIATLPIWLGNNNSTKLVGSVAGVSKNIWADSIISKAVKYTDTAFMLSGYARSGVSYSKAQSDAKYQLAGSYLTSSDLSPYLLTSTAASTYATVAQNALKINITDSAAMLAAYTRTGVAFTKAQSDARYLQSFSELDPKRVTTAAFAGSTTKTLTLTLADASTVTASFNDNNTGGSGGSNTVSLPITLTGADIGADTTTTGTGLATKGYALNLANGKASIAQLNTDTTAVGNRLTSVINATNGVVASHTTSIAGKEPTIAAGTTGQYWRGDKTWQTLPATGGTSLGWYNVLTYSADSTGTNDATTAFQNAINAIPSNGGTLYIPSGNFKILSQINISKPVKIIGNGGATTHLEPTTSRIFTTGTNVVFNVTSSGFILEDVTVSNTASSEPTSGSAVRVSGAGNHLEGITFSIFRCMIERFYRNVEVLSGNTWTIKNSHLHDPINANVYVSNNTNSDAGDATIEGCTLSLETASQTTAFTHVYHASSGGLRLVNNKFNGYPTIIPYCYYGGFNLSGTSVLVIADNSFENYKTSAIKLSPAGHFGGDVVIGNNQFSSHSNANNDIEIDSLTTLSIVGNTFHNSGSVNAIKLNKITNVTMLNTYTSYTTPIVLSNCLGITELNFNTVNSSTGQLSSPTISATAVGSTQISVTVGTVSNASSYVLEWSTDGSTGWAQLATTAGTYNHTGLTASTLYYYRARAIGNGTTYFTSTNATTSATTSSVSGITNILLSPNDFSNTDWSKNGTTITANATTDYLGGNTAAKLIANTGTNANNGHWIYQAIPNVANDAYGIELYAKSAELSTILISFLHGGTSSDNYCDLSTNVVTSLNAGTSTLASSITDAGNGWKKISLTVKKTSSTPETVELQIYTAVNSTSLGYDMTGNGTNGVYISHASLIKP